MRAGGAVSKWFMAILMVLAFCFIFGFYFKVSGNADEWISSQLNTHFKAYTGGRTLHPGKWVMLDREGNEWDNLSDVALNDLIGVYGEAEAKTRLDSVYHAFYNYQFGVVAQENRGLFGVDGVYNAKKGISKPDEDAYIVQATIASELSYKMLRALRATGADRGIIMAQNYKTGEILASAQTPAVSAAKSPMDQYVSKNEDEYIKKEGWLYDNAFRYPYQPGSIQKIATAIAIGANVDELDIPSDRNAVIFNCTGKYEAAGGRLISCTHAHGPISYIDAFAQSCNGFYASMAIKLGPKALTEAFEKLGYNKSFSYMGYDNSYMSVYSVREAAVDYTVGWSGAGQSVDGAMVEVLPMHMLALAGAIANEGSAYQPYTVASVSARDGKVLSVAKPVPIPANVLSLSREDAQDVTELMLKACKDKGTAVALGNAMGEQGFSVAAKTGTAEIDVNTGKGIISWIVAFAEEEPLAFLVCANNPASSQAAVNLAVEFMPEAMKLIAGDV